MKARVGEMGKYIRFILALISYGAFLAEKIKKTLETRR